MRWLIHSSLVSRKVDRSSFVLLSAGSALPVESILNIFRSISSLPNSCYFSCSFKKVSSFMTPLYSACISDSVMSRMMLRTMDSWK